MESRASVVTEEGKEPVIYSIAMEQAHFRSYNQHAVVALCGLIIFSISGPGSSSLEKRHMIACKLSIDYDHQMTMNAYTFLALISGGLLISVPSDLTSRLKCLVVSLVLYGLTTLTIGFCTGNYCFAFLSVIGAFWTSALLAVTVVYVAELQTSRSRGPSLCILQIFWLIGLVTPVSAIPWRISRFIFGILALIIAALIARYLPESPRLLLSLGKNEAAIKSLETIYGRSIRNHDSKYRVKKLEDDLSPESQDRSKLRSYVPKALRPPWYSFSIVLQVQFVLNLCYFTMSHWFREIHPRHVLIFPPKMSKKFDCRLGDKYSGANTHEINDFNSTACDLAPINADYYKGVWIVAIVTLTILVWMILQIDQFGRSYFATFSHLIGGLLSFWVHFVIGTKYSLSYTSIMESMYIVSSTASSCLVTEIFKTKFRVFGVALANAFGYIGMAMGLYGSLLSDGASCVFVISLTGILLTDKLLMELYLENGYPMTLKNYSTVITGRIYFFKLYSRLLIYLMRKKKQKK